MRGGGTGVSRGDAPGGPWQAGFGTLCAALRFRRSAFAGLPNLCGEVAEWSKAPHSKCGVPVRVPRVRIPASPPRLRCCSWGRRNCGAHEPWSLCCPDCRQSVGVRIRAAPPVALAVAREAEGSGARNISRTKFPFWQQFFGYGTRWRLLAAFWFCAELPSL